MPHEAKRTVTRNIIASTFTLFGSNTVLFYVPVTLRTRSSAKWRARTPPSHCFVCPLTNTEAHKYVNANAKVQKYRQQRFAIAFCITFVEIIETLSKAQRTRGRGLSSSFQSNLLGHITSSNTNLDQTSASNLDQALTSKSQPNITSSTKLRIQNIDQT